MCGSLTPAASGAGGGDEAAGAAEAIAEIVAQEVGQLGESLVEGGIAHASARTS